MVFISVWLKLVVNKYFAAYQCAHAWQIENLVETNFVENFGRAKQILSVQCVRTLTDWPIAGNLSNRSSGVQIPRDICTRFGRYLYSTEGSWIIIEHINKKVSANQDSFFIFNLPGCLSALHCKVYFVIYSDLFDMNIQCHSVSVQSTCLPNILYKLKLHREVGSVFIIHFMWLLELRT